MQAGLPHSAATPHLRHGRLATAAHFTGRMTGPLWPRAAHVAGRAPGAACGTARMQRAAGVGRRRDTEGKVNQAVLVLVLALVLVLLVHVLHVVLQEQDVGLVGAVDLERGLVVPLDGAPDLLAVLQHDDHARLVGHLFQVVEALRVRLLRGDGLAGTVDLGGRLELLLDLREVRADELAIHYGRPPVGGFGDGASSRARRKARYDQASR